MISYATDKEKRLSLLFILAILSVLISSYITTFFNENNLQLLAPSGIMVFLFLYWLFDRFTLKIPKIIELCGIPNFSGSYICNMIQVIDGVEKKNNAKIIIRQSINKISIYFESDGCTSTATSAGINIYGGKSGSKLEWNYNALDKTGSENPNKYGPGTTYVTFNNSDALEGRYYTAKGNRGKIYLETDS